MNTLQNTVVRARIDTMTKERATTALAQMGLSLSDAIRLLLVRVADEQRLPFDVKVPNRTSQEAIDQLEAGLGHKSTSVARFMAALNEND